MGLFTGGTPWFTEILKPIQWQLYFFFKIITLTLPLKKNPHSLLETGSDHNLWHIAFPLILAIRLVKSLFLLVNPLKDWTTEHPGWESRLRKQSTTSVGENFVGWNCVQKPCLLSLWRQYVNSIQIHWLRSFIYYTIHTLHYITLHYIALHCITLHYIALHYIPLHYITLHYITLHYITLHTITYHYIPLHTITYHYIPLHTITYHYIPLHTITYHYIPLHTITYHYIPLHTITYHYIPLHTITYHYIPLHTITYIHTYIDIYGYTHIYMDTHT